MPSGHERQTMCMVVENKCGEQEPPTGWARRQQAVESANLLIVDNLPVVVKMKRVLQAIQIRQAGCDQQDGHAQAMPRSAQAHDAHKQPDEQLLLRKAVSRCQLPAAHVLTPIDLCRFALCLMSTTIEDYVRGF